MAGMRHLPNLITALRFILIPVLVLLLLEQRYATAFAVFIVSAVSDLADGLIARRWNARTRLGAIADPLADKLTMLAVTLVLASQALIPVWLAAAIVVRDLVIKSVAQHSASAVANVTTRREAESAASSGTTTSQIAATDSMPPVNSAIIITGPASANEDSTCAPS
jgi:CDP-diacylglycerol--glycerol-3-phosphate 3-phosphatidyltransferase